MNDLNSVYISALVVDSDFDSVQLMDFSCIEKFGRVKVSDWLVIPLFNYMSNLKRIFFPEYTERDCVKMVGLMIFGDPYTEEPIDIILYEQAQMVNQNMVPIIDQGELKLNYSKIQNWLEGQ